MKGSHKIARMMRTLNGAPPMTLQTVIFHKDNQWSIREARTWLRDHGKVAGYADVKKDTIHFRQREPNDFDPTSFRSVHVGDGITLVVGHLKED